MHCLLISPEGITTFSVLSCYLLPMNTNISPVPSITRSLMHLSTLLISTQLLQIVSMHEISRLLKITYLQCRVFKPSFKSNVLTYLLRESDEGLRKLIIACYISVASASAASPSCQLLLHHSNAKFFNRKSLALSINLRPYQSMPVRWSSFLTIKLNGPFQASYRVPSMAFSGRSFNNRAFNSASRVYLFALATCSKSFCWCRLVRTYPRRHLQCVCSMYTHQIGHANR